MLDRLCYDLSMKTKRPVDINKLAAFIVDQAINEDKPKESEQPEKNKAAQELGRLGGLKGGKARAEKLTPEQRSEIAKKAAQARWKGFSDKI
jgi:hypothetical protein